MQNLAPPWSRCKGLVWYYLDIISTGCMFHGDRNVKYEQIILFLENIMEKYGQYFIRYKHFPNNRKDYAFNSLLTFEIIHLR